MGYYVYVVLEETEILGVFIFEYQFLYWRVGKNDKWCIKNAFDLELLNCNLWDFV